MASGVGTGSPGISKPRDGGRFAEKHGESMSGSPTYRSWVSMRQRINDPGHHNFPLYGGRGITICERWGEFEYFLADMGERPPGMTLDRIDPDGNYEPPNVRWATHSQQSNNRSPMTRRGGSRPGKKLSPESIAKRTAMVRGQKRSLETKARMRTARLAWWERNRQAPEAMTWSTNTPP